MNSRERFFETMFYGKPDRVPYFEEGIRQEVLNAWFRQGLSPDDDLEVMFHTDRREEFTPDIGPRPYPKRWPATVSELNKFRHCFDVDDPGRLPEDWSDRVQAWQDRQHVLMLRVHEGFFLSLGVGDWQRFYEVIHQVKDDLHLVRELLILQGELSAQLSERILQEVKVDAVVFSEPIGGMHGPLISPWMYEELVLSTYLPILNVVNKFGIQTIILRTYANARVLLPRLLNYGFNCLWACECETGSMNYHEIRAEFGKDLRLVGGIDLDALRFGRQSIRDEVMEQVPALLASGGYIPLADGRVREDVPFDDYVYYRHLLEEITQV
jgi:hypothetical protein